MSNLDTRTNWSLVNSLMDLRAEKFVEKRREPFCFDFAELAKPTGDAPGKKDDRNKKLMICCVGDPDPNRSCRMVARDAPEPVPRPSPSLGHGLDESSFG